MRTSDESESTGVPSPAGVKGDGTPKSALPIVPPGFAIDLIAEAPDILWPSVVHALPDGSILVGEDSMDMPGPTDQPLDRILQIAFHADGTLEKKVFADHLFATFGMEEIDGDVYVMNMPHLTRFSDTDGDGVADQRREILTDLGPPAPGWPDGFNDHIVSGIRLGMDGFLYIAVGDKGIPLAHGSDGSTLTLRGGGVVRVRPDGSQLQVVASGLRNILDVAIDARGEMFTYDNTDDGLGWWTRLTHVIPGGYYGYPWDYHDHKDRMLPCMKDYGGGSPCGGLVYREAAWPQEFQGSLFFCEWGKGVLRRFELEPDRATFKVKSDEDFVRAGDVRSFRPLDVRESPDGRFLYMTDWGFDGWRAPAQAGRLWRIRRAGDDPKVPSVARALPPTIDALIAALDDPSFNHRLRAQRELVRRGRDAFEPLSAVYAGGGPLRARIHALWALVEIDPERASELLRSGLTMKPLDIRVQTVRAMGLHPATCGRWLTDAFRDPNVRNKREVFSALCTGGADVAPELTQALAALFYSANPVYGTLPGLCDPFLRFGLMSALRKAKFVPDVAASKERALALELLRDRYDPAVVEALEKIVVDDSFGVQTRATTLGLLSALCRKPAPWDGKWWNIQPAKGGPPQRTLEWEKTAEIQAFLRARLTDRAADVRRAALEAVRDTSDRAALSELRARYALDPIQNNRRITLEVLAALRDEDCAELLATILRDPKTTPSLRAAAIETACTIGTPAMVDLLCGIAADLEAPSSDVVPCVRALARLKAHTAKAVLVQRASAGPEDVRSAAITALAEIEGEAASADLRPLLADPSHSIRNAAIRAYGTLPVPSVSLLLPLVDEESTRADAIGALAKHPDPRALSAYLLGLSSSASSVRDVSRSALGAVRESVRGELEALAARGALDEPTLAALQSIYTEPQPIVAWKILGPFARDASQPVVVGPVRGGTVSSNEIDAVHFDWTRRMAGLAGAELQWRDWAAEPVNGFVDLEIAVAGGQANVVAFAAGVVVSSRDREAEISAGSDDSLSAWVNGEIVHEFGGNRGWKADEDRFRVHLKAGSNSILLCIGNTTGQWSFNAKVSGDPTGPLFEHAAAAPASADYSAFARAHPGDPARGYKLFHEHPGLMCIRCHTIGGAGAQVGPDLSDVAAKYSREDIIASVLEPSKRIGDGYRAVTLELKDGVLVSGLVKSETEDELALYDTNGELRRVAKDEIAARRTSGVSLMPAGQWTLLKPEEFSDLIAYLATLRGSPGAKKNP
jgi:putative membrane-bound dehydrogenase-like protein